MHAFLEALNDFKTKTKEKVKGMREDIKKISSILEGFSTQIKKMKDEIDFSMDNSKNANLRINKLEKDIKELRRQQIRP